MRFRTLAVVVPVAITAAACGGEKAAPLTVLDQPEMTLDRSFQQVSNVIELRDGRIALAELKDKSFLFVDPKNGEVTPIGEYADTIAPGDPAPGKHKLPGFVLRFPGDTVALIDFAAQRTTLWNEKGEFIGVLPGAGVGGFNQPLNYDNQGRGYKEDIRNVLGGLEPGQEVDFDSLALMRIARGSATADTIARLKLPPWGQGQFGEQQKIVSTIFAGRDLYGVLPDGSLWIARASNNAVDWLNPDGTWTKGPARKYETIPVPQAEKDEFLEKLRNQMASMGAPAGVELMYPFADTKAPFGAGLTDLSGQVWLQRSRAWQDSIPVWDVVGRDGKGVRSVQLPKGASIGGFGADGKLYLILREGDNVQKIARYIVK